MDQRITLNTNEKFDALLQKAFDDKEPVRLLFDNNSLQRAEGIISELNLQSEKPFVVLEDGQQTIIESIIGMNGVFKDDYTEC